MTSVGLTGRPSEVDITITGDGFAYRIIGTPPPPSVYVGQLGDPVVLVTCRQ